jgi:hypothetical protein
MPIAFRCTRCRARLHVPTRWQGTSVACPKCATRVVVPVAEAEESSASPFERRDVERSLAALEPSPGGIFAAETFELPTSGVDPTDSDPGGPPAGPRSGLTVPRRAIYASMGYAAAAILGFGLGWLAALGRLWR